MPSMSPFDMHTSLTFLFQPVNSSRLLSLCVTLSDSSSLILLKLKLSEFKAKSEPAVPHRARRSSEARELRLALVVRGSLRFLATNTECGRGC